MNAWPLVEKAIKQLIETKYPAAAGKTGGDLSYNGSSDFYVWLGLVPGGSSDEINGTWIIDIDVFAKSYSKAMTVSNDLEALLIGSRHVTPTMRLDTGSQNEGPAERPWDDESAFRVGATYVFTARRSG